MGNERRRPVEDARILQVLALLEQHPHGMTTPQVARALDVGIVAARNTLRAATVAGRCGMLRWGQQRGNPAVYVPLATMRALRAVESTQARTFGAVTSSLGAEQGAG